MEREKPTTQLPYGVSPIVREFLLDCIRCKAPSTLDEPKVEKRGFIPTRQRNLIGAYYGSDATTYDLGRIYRLDRKTVTLLIKEGMSEMWKVLPDDLRDKYKEEEILKMKEGHSQKTKDKLSLAMSGRRFPYRRRNPALREIVSENRGTALRGLRAWSEKRRQGEDIQEGPYFIGLIRWLPETALVGYIRDLSERNGKGKRKKKPLMVDEVCEQLRYLGVSHNTEQIQQIVDILNDSNTLLTVKSAGKIA